MTIHHKSLLMKGSFFGKVFFSFWDFGLFVMLLLRIYQRLTTTIIVSMLILLYIVDFSDREVREHWSIHAGAVEALCRYSNEREHIHTRQTSRCQQC